MREHQFVLHVQLTYIYSLGNDELLDPEYHDLLVSVSTKAPVTNQPGLHILASFFKALRSRPALITDQKLLSSANVSFQFLFLGNSALQKAEHWEEVWAALLNLLALADGRKEGSDVPEELRSLVKLVSNGLSGSLAHSQSRKKVSKSLYPGYTSRI